MIFYYNHLQKQLINLFKIAAAYYNFLQHFKAVIIWRGNPLQYNNGLFGGNKNREF